MSALDTLYGAGTFTKLTALLKGIHSTATATESLNPDGSVDVEMQWSGDLLRMACYPTRVHFVYLSTTCSQKLEVGATTYKALCAQLPSLFRGLGVTDFTAAPLDAASETLLLSQGGFSPTGTGSLHWTL